MLSQALKKTLGTFFVFYPITVFVSLRFMGPWGSSALLAFLLSLRLVFFRKRSVRPGMARLTRIMEIVMGVFLFGNLLNLYLQSEWVLRLYPVLMSLGAALVFAHSLWIQQPIIEHFARMLEKELSASQLQYIKSLTWVWSIWLVLNSFIAFLTAYSADLRLWSLYNGLIFYLVSGMLVAGDLLYRKCILKDRGAHVLPR